MAAKLRDSSDAVLQQTVVVQGLITSLWLILFVAHWPGGDSRWWIGVSYLVLAVLQGGFGLFAARELWRRSRASRAQAARFAAMDAEREPTMVYLDGSEDAR